MKEYSLYAFYGRMYSWFVYISVLLCVNANVRSSSYVSRRQVTERGCVVIDELCLQPHDVPSYEAIKALHLQLDDDKSGDIDLSESVDFLKEELRYTKGIEKRQEVFHYNNDKHISVHELWNIWRQSEVHNWTVEQTVSWLIETVELPQYAQNFYENAVNGSVLPSFITFYMLPHQWFLQANSSTVARLATTNEQFLTKVLGIKSLTHKSKITIKAMDVVLFGPPKGSHLKDAAIILLLTALILGAIKFYHSAQKYETQFSKMLQDIDQLRTVEKRLNEELVKFEHSVTTDARELSPSPSDAEIDKSVALLDEHDKKSFDSDEECLESRSRDSHWVVHEDLQYWLQLTYERERLAFNKRQAEALENYQIARDMCDKLNRQRHSVFGVFASVHGKMDKVDQAISHARNNMEQVTFDLQEREHRWRQIESLSRFSITQNAGIHALELRLRPHLNGHTQYSSGIVHQLLKNQSALMFLTMGGYSGLANRFGSTSSSSSLFSLKESSQYGSRLTGLPSKKQALMDSASVCSDTSVMGIGSGSILHHSHTVGSEGLGSCVADSETASLRRSSSAGSVGRHTLNSFRQYSNDSNDSSNDDFDASSRNISRSQQTLCTLSSTRGHSSDASQGKENVSSGHDQSSVNRRVKTKSPAEDDSKKGSGSDGRANKRKSLLESLRLKNKKGQPKDKSEE